MAVRRFVTVAIGVVIGTVGAAIAWATIHPAPHGVRYGGSYIPLQDGQSTSAYASTLHVTVDPTTHPSWAVVLPIGLAAGIVLALGVAAVVNRRASS